MKYQNAKLKDFIESLKGKRIVIMGLGVHGGGVGVAKFFSDSGAQVIVTDLKTSADLSSSLVQLSLYKNIQHVLGEHREKDFAEADLVIKNPGVADSSKFLNIARDKGTAIDSDIGIFFNLSPAPIIGVSGTKGKSTTAKLIEGLLKPHFKTVLAGNIRISALEVLPEITPDHWVVLELSSWQLEGLIQHQISPKIAVLTNIDQDHLNRYPSFESYMEAKKIIFRYQSSEDFLVLNANSPNLVKFADESIARVFFSGTDLSEIPLKRRGSTIKNGWFVWQEEKIAPLETLKLIGKHNIQNVLTAITVAKLLDIPDESIKKSIAQFKTLPGRLEIVRKIKHITFINDTTSTTPIATMEGIHSFSKPIILIAGGADKNLDYRDFVEIIQKTVKAVILLPGDATEKIKQSLKYMFDKRIALERTAWYEAKDMDEAVSTAWRIAETDDIVLLSPAAASFGLFVHEFERGDAFVRFVDELYVRNRRSYNSKKEQHNATNMINEHNTSWELWHNKFGGRYLGHVSRAYSWLLERKIDLTPLDISTIPRLFDRVAKVETALQPKQVAFDPETKLAFVSCMQGKKLQVFNCNNNDLNIVDEISFEDQCVEIAIHNNLCFVTLSKFSRLAGVTDKLAIIDLGSRKVLSIIDTGGSWSKVIRVHPRNLVFVSNWRSNNLSIIDINDPSQPQVIQILPCGISPRGMAFSKTGELGLVAGFYSRNIIEICSKTSRQFEVSFIGDPYDFPNYSGCMRDIIIDRNDEYAYLTNLGRSLIHVYHISRRKIVDSILVGKYPNSIVFFDSSEKNLLVSCRESNTVCLVDIDTRIVEGCTEPIIKKSTGLTTTPGGFLVTNFADNYLELYNIIE